MKIPGQKLLFKFGIFEIIYYSYTNRLYISSYNLNKGKYFYKLDSYILLILVDRSSYPYSMSELIRYL